VDESPGPDGKATEPQDSLLRVGDKSLFQSLEDNTEVFYQMSEFYAPELARGLRYDDPKLRIPWPLPVSAVSEKDEAWPLL
jgi:dTDP-4-dehydrorhamnose 3,5-epimerase